MNNQQHIPASPAAKDAAKQFERILAPSAVTRRAEWRAFRDEILGQAQAARVRGELSDLEGEILDLTEAFSAGFDNLWEAMESWARSGSEARPAAVVAASDELTRVEAEIGQIRARYRAHPAITAINDALGIFD